MPIVAQIVVQIAEHNIVDQIVEQIVEHTY
jgi:hypothetical protein